MKDTPVLLQVQQQNARPVSGEELEVMGKRAARMWAGGCASDLSESVTCVVKEANLSPEQVKRVAEFANVNAFLEEFNKEGTASKYVDFGENKLADVSRILQDLNDGGSGDQGELVDFESHAYDEQPPQEKVASLEDSDWVAVFGDPSKEEDYPMAEPHAEFWAAREKLAGMRDHLTYQLSGLETMYGDISRNLYGQVKRACREGISLGDVVKAWSTVDDDPELLKHAFEFVSGKLVKDEVFDCFDSVAESIAKMGSARVVNPQHPLVTFYGEWLEVLDKLAETREQRDGLAERVAFMEYQFEKTGGKGGAIGKAWRGLGAIGKHTGSIGEAIGGEALGKVTKYVPHAAAGAGLAAVGAEATKQIEDSPTANLLLSGVPGTIQEQRRRAIRQQAKMMEAQSNPIARLGMQYMG